MARLRTLTQLIADVRQRADIENSTHISDTEITRYINQGAVGLHAMIVDQNEDEFAADVSIVGTAGMTQAYIIDPGGPIEPGSAPLSVYKVLAVDRIETDGTSCPMRRFTLQERAILESTSWPSTSRRSLYRLRGMNQILFAPALSADCTVRVTYIPAMTDLDGSTNTFYDGRDGWEEWVTLDAAIRCLIKEESDTSDLVRERAMVEARLVKQMATRDQHEPHRMTDVRPYIVEKW